MCDNSGGRLPAWLSETGDALKEPSAAAEIVTCKTSLGRSGLRRRPSDAQVSFPEVETGIWIIIGARRLEKCEEG